MGKVRERGGGATESPVHTYLFLFFFNSLRRETISVTKKPARSGSFSVFLVIYTYPSPAPPCGSKIENPSELRFNRSPQRFTRSKATQDDTSTQHSNASLTSYVCEPLAQNRYKQTAPPPGKACPREQTLYINSKDKQNSEPFRL